ncbi:MAG: hypothetical protein CM15mV10_2800 [uncultured marine virus]|nr:MAG: hypothetical protein CM15mV10_2800 [uncultured marine virus]
MNRYQVWLQRDNGIPKTVIVDDCYYEDEARLLAESQYGLPVSKVLYQGKSNTGQYQHDLEPHIQTIIKIYSEMVYLIYRLLAHLEDYYYCLFLYNTGTYLLVL